MKQIQKNAGFTLIELALYGGLLSILLLILTQFFIAILQVQLVSQSDSALQQDSKYIVERMTYDVRRMKSLSLPALGQSVATISGVIADPGGDASYTYRVQNEQLSLTIDGVVTQLNSDQTYVSSFTASRIGNSGQISGAKDTVRLVFTLVAAATPSSGPKTLNTQTTISLR